nr:hypothetical protein CFP56_03692 [Quercus suber]
MRAIVVDRVFPRGGPPAFSATYLLSPRQRGKSPASVAASGITIGDLSPCCGLPGRLPLSRSCRDRASSMPRGRCASKARAAEKGATSAQCGRGVVGRARDKATTNDSTEPRYHHHPETGVLMASAG